TATPVAARPATNDHGRRGRYLNAGARRCRDPCRTAHVGSHPLILNRGDRRTSEHAEDIPTMTTMNPLLFSILQSFARWGLAFLAGYLVRKGVWNADEAASYVASLSSAVALTAIGVGWSLWSNYKDRVKFLTAL